MTTNCKRRTRPRLKFCRAVLVPLVLVACAGRNPGGASEVGAAPPAAPQAPEYETVEIRLERTACYGTCPVYEVTIDQEGRVEYQGALFVAVQGRRTRQIQPEKVRRLVARFYEVGFFSMKNRYAKLDVTDLPTTITQIIVDGRRKRVENYSGGPEALRRLESMIDETAGVAEWIGEAPGSSSPQCSRWLPGPTGKGRTLTSAEARSLR